MSQDGRSGDPTAAPTGGTERWERLLNVTVAVFTVWFLLFLYRFWVPAAVADASRSLHGTTGVVPTVTEGTVRAVVAPAVKWGLPLSVGLFLVAFALFHRASATLWTVE